MKLESASGLVDDQVVSLYLCIYVPMYLYLSVISVRFRWQSKESQTLHSKKHLTWCVERSTSLNDYKECAVNTQTNDPDHNKNCLFCELLEDLNKKKKMKKKTVENWVKIYCNFSGKYKEKKNQHTVAMCSKWTYIHSFIYLHSFLFIHGLIVVSLSAVCLSVHLSHCLFHQWNFMTNHVVRLFSEIYKVQTQIRLQN